MLAGLISTHAVAALNVAQSLYTLPVSLFGMSFQRPSCGMSSVVGTTDEIASQLRQRLDGGLSRIAFFIVLQRWRCWPWRCHDGRLYQTGKFTQDATIYVWGILAGRLSGCLPRRSRMYSSTYYALHDTRTPLLFAVIRVALTTGLVICVRFRCRTLSESIQSGVRQA